MRPTFQLELPCGKEEFMPRLLEALQQSPGGENSLVFEDYIELHIPNSELRYWSPHLSLHFSGDEHRTRVFGRYAPRQDVWTFIWVVYLFFAFTAFFSVIYAYAQWVLGEFPWAAVLVPLALLGIGLLYVASDIGQRWSSDQMHRLGDQWSALLSRARAGGG